MTLDSPNPRQLARFYQHVVGGEVFSDNEDFVVLEGERIRLDFQRVANPSPVPWPDAASPRRVHLDFVVEDIDATEARLTAIGATRPAFQPGGQRFRVLVDPAGHVFCLASPAAAVTPTTRC